MEKKYEFEEIDTTINQISPGLFELFWNLENKTRMASSLSYIKLDNSIAIGIRLKGDSAWSADL